MEGSDNEVRSKDEGLPASPSGSHSSHEDDHLSVHEDEHIPTEEDILRREAATWLQRTIRGHAARRRALFTPIWVKYPSVVRQGTWGYQGFFDALDVEAVKRSHGFTEQLGLLHQVLETGLGALPHLFDKELTRPMVKRRTRSSYLRGLIEFCLEMGDAYSRWGKGGQAEFMWQSAETLCLLPPCNDTNASRTLDPCNFKVKPCYLVYAQDQLAMMHYKRGEYEAAVASLDKGLDTCQQRAVGRLPYFLLQSHRAVVLSAMRTMDCHEKAFAILEQYIPSLNTAMTNPLGHLELMETPKVVSHLLVLSFHNVAVQCVHLKQWDKAIEFSARVLSLVDSGLHKAQPIRRHFFHAHVASLRMEKAHVDARVLSPYVPAKPEEHQDKGKKKGLLNSNLSSDSISLDTSTDGVKEGRWNKWLALAGQGRAVAPILANCPRPNVDSLASLEKVPARGFRLYSDVLDAATDQYPKLDRMETCPEEVLGTVSRAIFHFIDDGAHSKSVAQAGERYEQAQKLLDEDLFDFCNQLRWDVQVYAILAKAYFLYNRLEDYENTVVLAERALQLAKAQEGGGYHTAICKLCIGACLLRVGQHDEAFSIAKAALTYCHGLSDEELQDAGVKTQLEDILVAASHLMALTHIFLGNSKVALKLSKICREHIKNTSYYENKSTLQYTQVLRVYETAMSMTELVKDKNNFQTAPKRSESIWTDKQSKVVPTKFVPGALTRNLPELYPNTTRVRIATRESFVLAGESVVAQVLHKDNARMDGAVKEATSPQGEEDIEEAGAHVSFAHHSQKINIMSFDDTARKRGSTSLTIASSAPPSRMQTSTSTTFNGGRGKTPYGELVTKTGEASHDPTITGHAWVDELIKGKERKEEVRNRFASDPSANMYFAKVYSQAKDESSVIIDPLNKVVPKKKFVVGDHMRTSVRGRKAPNEGSTRGNTTTMPHLLRDWGPDPTRLLRSTTSMSHASRHSLSSLDASKTGISAIPVRSQTSLGLVSEQGLDMSGSTVDSLEQLRQHKRKEQELRAVLDFNEIRVMKHAPFDTVVRQSAMGAFVSRGERDAILHDVDRYCIENNAHPVTATSWPEEDEQSQYRLRSSRSTGSSFNVQREREIQLSSTADSQVNNRLYPTAAKTSVARPWYWTHAPEYPTSSAQNKLRVEPYGENLTPAAKQAYGSNGSAAFGVRSLGTVRISQQDIVNGAELSKKPASSSISTVSTRSLA